MSAIRHHIQSLERYVARRGARLTRAELPESVHGRVAAGHITLRARLSPEEELLALVHELAHWLAHRYGEDNTHCPSQTVCEYEAEAVEALVMSRLGFVPAAAHPATDEAGFPTDGLLSSSVVRVRCTSRTICQALGLDLDD
jgi:hypothetical protein